jgi:hypothetical protein
MAGRKPAERCSRFSNFIPQPLTAIIGVSAIV